MGLTKKNAGIILDINQTANNFKSSIVIRTDNKNLDAKSLLGLTYTIISSRTYKLEIHGLDEEDAKIAMIQVFGKHGIPVEVL
ncbi:MAG: HPr family phosphocarrier protein [Bacillota bacterium]